MLHCVELRTMKRFRRETDSIVGIGKISWHMVTIKKSKLTVSGFYLFQYSLPVAGDMLTLVEPLPRIPQEEAGDVAQWRAPD